MNIQSLHSGNIYRKVAEATMEEKKELFRREMLAPFMKKWEIQQIPFKTDDPYGFDVLTFNNLMNLSPNQITSELAADIEFISSDMFWSECEAAVKKSLNLFEQNGVSLPVQDYLFTIQLGSPDSVALRLNEGYSGDGGIPGYILCTFIPNDYTKPRLKAALAHECNHNVRYQFIKWDHAVTLGELIVSEGLAESYATWMFGEELLGPWVAKTNFETLNSHIKPGIKDQLHLTGFDKIFPYLYGDELARLQHFDTVNMPYCAGYACGYYLIQYYLEKTGKTIFEATITPANQILDEVKEFWHEATNS